ncbi:MAG: ABC transporter ATP-binding protein [Promethearchaeota archaeon]
MINIIHQTLLTELNMMFTSIFMLIFIIFILIGLIAGYTSMSDKSQLLEPSTYLLTVGISSIPVGIYIVILFFQLGENFAIESAGYLIPLAIIAFISNIIVKYFSFKTIKYKEIQTQKSIETGKILLKVEDLRVFYPIFSGMFKSHIADVKAVDGISFDIKSGETLGLVGESGCGKTTVARTILGLVKKKSGQIYYNDKPISHKLSNELRQKIQVIYQNPDASLNPRKKVVDIIAEPLVNLMGITDKNKLRVRVLELLELVSLKREHMDRYPHEFSGGQKQRIVIARALACNPELILLDEPTSALDVSVQAQILNLLKDLQEEFGYAYLFITHNLSVIHHIANRIAVMYLGKFVETGTIDQIFDNTAHPYSIALLSARSQIDPENKRKMIILKGEVPSPINPPSGCSFNPRCFADFRTEQCEINKPTKIEIEPGHFSWCPNQSNL